jgi:glycosyltransferase involved in cell wall biosynthesis
VCDIGAHAVCDIGAHAVCDIGAHAVCDIGAHAVCDIGASAAAALPLVLHTRVVTGVGGGPEKTILNSPRFLPELGYRAICAYMRPAKDDGFTALRAKAREAKAQLLEVDDGGPLDFGLVRRFIEICRRENVAIWHGHDYKSNLLGILVRRHWPMKLVTTVHGWVKHTWRTPLYYALDRLSLRWYDRVICVSDDLHAASLRSGVRADRCVLIENAIDTAQFQRQHSTSAAKRKLGFNPERRLIGAVGRLSPEKGFDVLIRAVGLLVSSGADVDLAIAGDGDDQARLTGLIADLGLSDRVRLLGYRSDARQLYEAFDVFALSSYREGLPNVVLEAMALETPVVATAIAGVPRVISDQQNGLLVPAGDVAALAGALGRVLGDVVLAQRLSQAGRQTIEQRFSFGRRMQKVARVYDELLGTREVPP